MGHTMGDGLFMADFRTFLDAFHVVANWIVFIFDSRSSDIQSGPSLRIPSIHGQNLSRGILQAGPLIFGLL